MDTTKKIIAYYRVSTKRQNLGLEAQRIDVMKYAAENGCQVIDEVSEKESGKEDERPGINLAIAKAKKYGAALVAAKVDRISRDISFCAKVFFKSGIEVIALNLPSEVKDPLLFSVYFGLAQQEAKMISERTKAGLAAKDAKNEALAIEHLRKAGVREEEMTFELIREIRQKYYWYPGRPGWTIPESQTKAAVTGHKAKADTNSNNIAAANELRRYFAASDGKRNLSAAARHLNDLQLYTSRGVFHTAMSVKLLVRRFAI